MANGRLLRPAACIIPACPALCGAKPCCKMKRLGFNTVQTYAFWNFHEPKENEWDFSGDKDLDAFLKLVKAVGNVRHRARRAPTFARNGTAAVTPSGCASSPICAFGKTIPAFEAEVDKWLGKVMPIVAANQINRGGSVIMVQLENEHPQGWGREMPNNYFRHMRDTALCAWIGSPVLFQRPASRLRPGGREFMGQQRPNENPWYSYGILARLV